VSRNKYAKACPTSATRRLWHVDAIEELAIARARAVRGRLANVQPHSGAQAISPFFWPCSSPVNDPGDEIFPARGPLTMASREVCQASGSGRCPLTAFADTRF